MEKPEYYTVLPSRVRYDERLKPMEKIMYSELTVLSHVKGYCYANNTYFAKLYGVHKNTVSVWINNLVKCGHITTKCIMKDKQVEERRIYIVEKGKKNSFVEEKEFENLEEKNFEVDKKVEIKTENKNIEEEKKLSVEERLFEQISDEDDEIEDFEENLVEELFSKSKYQVIEEKEGQEKVEELSEKKIVEENISEEKFEEEIVKELENEEEEKTEKREKTPEELEEVRRKLLKDLFGEKFVREVQERKAEEEESKKVEESVKIEEEKEERASISGKVERVTPKIMGNQKMVGVSIEKLGGYLLKNLKPINKKIEDNITSLLLQEEYILHTHICGERIFLIK